ncbi:hypothetical protein [Roseovarius sp. MMSF_3281]|uniref:hypothetical protein n=1 Tax=Roseovarius sp. MMSF_3281 TaxID=3046694 RepID=UPI00273F87C2|nr:hypothetical protein [Roseovarius sp. MMSF_3281]
MKQINEMYSVKNSLIPLSLALAVSSTPLAFAQTLPTSKEEAMMAGSYMAVMNLCLDDVDLYLTAKAKAFAQKAQNSQPEAFDGSYNAEGHAMTFYDKEGCLSVWRRQLGPTGKKSKKIGFTIMMRGNS